MLVMREDGVTIAGTVRSVWFDSTPMGQPQAEAWNIAVEVDKGDAARLLTSDGRRNALGG